jgi:hypothetical protein
MWDLFNRIINSWGRSGETIPLVWLLSPSIIIWAQSEVVQPYELPKVAVFITDSIELLFYFPTLPLNGGPSTYIILPSGVEIPDSNPPGQLGRPYGELPIRTTSHRVSFQSYADEKNKNIDYIVQYYYLLSDEIFRRWHANLIRVCLPIPSNCIRCNPVKKTPGIGQNQISYIFWYSLGCNNLTYIFRAEFAVFTYLQLALFPFKQKLHMYIFLPAILHSIEFLSTLASGVQTRHTGLTTLNLAAI